MRRVEDSTVVARPAEDVFALIGDPGRDEEWATVVLSSRQTSPGPLAAGATFEQTLRFLGRRHRLEFGAAEYEPGRRLTIEPRRGPAGARGQRIVEPMGEGVARVTFAAEGPMPFLPRFADPLVAWAVRRALRKGLAEAKSHLEAAAPASRA
jgi:Polyketide cyclase / dehydrase and lipid transport